MLSVFIMLKSHYIPEKHKFFHFLSLDIEILSVFSDAAISLQKKYGSAFGVLRVGLAATSYIPGGILTWNDNFVILFSPDPPEHSEEMNGTTHRGLAPKFENIP